MNQNNSKPLSNNSTTIQHTITHIVNPTDHPIQFKISDIFNSMIIPEKIKIFKNDTDITTTGTLTIDYPNGIISWETKKLHVKEKAVIKIEIIYKINQ